MIELKKCPICKNEEWQNLDDLRDIDYWTARDVRIIGEPVSMKVCKKCAFVTYDYIEEKRLSEHYDRERPVMNALNIITCNRKNMNHEFFLRDFFNERPVSKMKVLDVGCAQGYFLRFCESHGFRRENLYGAEWSESFVNFAKYEYGLNVKSDIDMSIKYDFISYYHVFEHIQNPDLELDKINNILADGGFLYMSVPVFFHELDEASGSLCMDFENLYHLNHVNVFSFQSLRNILHSKGFEIVKENRNVYGYTVLCKKGNPEEIKNEEYREVVESLRSQKKAVELMKQKRYEEAIEEYPKYPDAYILYSLNVENMKNFDNQVSILNKGLSIMPNCAKLLSKLAQVYLQWDENTPNKNYYSNNIRLAESLFKKCFEIKPAEDMLFFLGMIEHKYKGNYDEAAAYFRTQMEINPMKFQENWNLISAVWKSKSGK